MTVLSRRAVGAPRWLAAAAVRDRRVFQYYAPLRRVERYVRDHLAEPISTNEIAKVAHLGPTYFCHFFRAKTGLTFRQWLAARRVERAVSLLAEEDYSVAQVAEAVGLHNRRTFERWFRRVTGMTPQQFKQRAKPA